MTSTSTSCIARRRVVLRRLGSGKKSLRSTLTSADGSWSITRARRPRGSVYAVVADRSSGLTICKVGTSS